MSSRSEAPSVLFTLLPGPGRKRTANLYGYRLTYRNPDPEAVGCVCLWEVSGGRLPYQLALERVAPGVLRLQCTCADAVFRGESTGRLCKHVRGLMQFGTPGPEPTERPLGLGA